jgi:carboxypeptidase T
MVALISAEKFRASITYHSFSQLLLYPGAAEHDDFVQFVGKGMSQLIDANGNPYKYQSGDALYPTTGDMLEYCYDAAPGRPTFTPELRPNEWATAELFFSGLPESEIEPTFKENLGAALALINAAGFDTPPAVATIKWTPDTRVAQVVRNAWKVFQGFGP